MEALINNIVASKTASLSGEQIDYLVSSLPELYDTSYQEIASFYAKKYGLNEQDVYDFLFEYDRVTKEFPNREYPHQI